MNADDFLQDKIRIAKMYAEIPDNIMSEPELKRILDKITVNFCSNCGELYSKCQCSNPVKFSRPLSEMFNWEHKGV